MAKLKVVTITKWHQTVGICSDCKATILPMELASMHRCPACDAKFDEDDALLDFVAIPKLRDLLLKSGE
ncbi:MAG: hypothetical protein MJ025_00145 [Victivallaceae bacterium]|nr:hypothetical protein [Victivallaceae bacterium]